jgi:hypothetical protein
MNKQEMVTVIADALQAGRINLDEARLAFDAIAKHFGEQA